MLSNSVYIPIRPSLSLDIIILLHVAGCLIGYLTRLVIRDLTGLVIGDLMGHLIEFLYKSTQYNATPVYIENSSLYRGTPT